MARCRRHVAGAHNWLIFGACIFLCSRVEAKKPPREAVEMAAWPAERNLLHGDYYTDNYFLAERILNRYGIRCQPAAADAIIRQLRAVGLAGIKLIHLYIV